MSDATHIILRKLEPDDLSALYAWENDADAWLDGDTHNPVSKADLREYILRTTGDVYQDGQLRLIICHADALQQPVGCVDLYNVDIRNRKAAVAIYIAPEYRRKGIALHALKQLKSYVVSILHFRFLYAFVRDANYPSLNLFQNVGFQNVACLPNWVLEGDIFVLQTAL